ncbi:MAG: redoxin domain-containing protein [Solirubrobacterales bacterium]
MRPERANIAAPELPGRLPWLGVERRPRMVELSAAGPVLVHFFDFAQLNSVRALPYAVAWNERYRDAGLTTLGIHSPRFSFTAERAALAAALKRLGVRHPVAVDSGYAVWHDYGCKGWPSLFLWGQRGALRWFHFGEGEYAATEEAIAEELEALDPSFEPPRAVEPLRPSDAPGALVAPPTEEVFPGGSPSEPWRAASAADGLELTYEAGGAHASVSGTGELSVTLDGGEGWRVEVKAPGLYDLAVHPRHQRHELRLGASPGVELYSVSFSAGVP